MNDTFLSWFLNVVTRNFRMSRGGRLHLDGNKKGYELAEHISTKVEVNPRMLSTFVAICSATSYPFGFPSRSKRPTLYILKFLVTKLRNQDNKVAFIIVDEYVALARYSEFMKICHNMNIIVQNTGGDASSLNGKSESSNKTLSILKSSVDLPRLLWLYDMLLRTPLDSHPEASVQLFTS